MEPVRERTMSDAVLTVPPIATIASDDYRRLVESMAVPHRHKEAKRRLMAAGSQATPALRWGLRHHDPTVRSGCCDVLDHYLDEAAVPELVACLTDESSRVRGAAIHALACERCKEGACRPGEDDVIPLVVRLLLEDENKWVRKGCAHLLSTVVHRRPDVIPALEHARDHDPERIVRFVAGLNAPGGVRFERTTPKPIRHGIKPGPKKTA